MRRRAEAQGACPVGPDRRVRAGVVRRVPDGLQDLRPHRRPGERLAKAGGFASVGSAAILVLADDRCVVDAALNFTRFYRNESCGKCVPCRVGSQKIVDIIAGIAQAPPARATSPRSNGLSLDPRLDVHLRPGPGRPQPDPVGAEILPVGSRRPPEQKDLPRRRLLQRRTARRKREPANVGRDERERAALKEEGGEVKMRNAKRKSQNGRVRGAAVFNFAL